MNLVRFSSSDAGQCAGHSSRHLSGFTLAALDDSPEVIRLVQLYLEGTGACFYGFSETESFLRFIEQSVPDLVLLDIVMPRLDGFEVFSRLRNSPDTAKIPVIFVSCIMQKEDEIPGECEDERTAILAKPFLRVDLLRKIGELMGKA